MSLRAIAAMLAAVGIFLGGCVVEPPPPPRVIWVPGYYAYGPYGYSWVEGYWRVP